jgi:large subunit ribosomal protein L9
MKVLLLKDVYKLGRAGDVKRVADGFGRNFLIPQRLATLATPGAMTQAERIRESATKERARLNEELGAVAEQLNGLTLNFPVKAGETGKLYGSITSAMIMDSIKEASGIELDKRQLDAQPIKTLGVHTVEARLTIDLTPELTILVYREGDAPETAYGLDEDLVAEAEEAGQFVELAAELEAEFDEALEEMDVEQDLEALLDATAATLEDESEAQDMDEVISPESDEG